jgi:2',3'-cyclic-nucleotide 2'-phosphodiesterase (5'-nucleotidase family)
MYKLKIQFGRFSCLGLLLVLVTNSGCFTKKLQLDQMKTEYAVVDPGTVADPEIKSLVQDYKEQLDSKMNEVIGTAAMNLSNDSDTAEFPLGNFVADLMLIESTKGFGSPIDIALINARGGLRVPISKGAITVGNIFELMPFENDVWILELTGDETQRLFDHCTRTEKMAVAGARYQMDGRQATEIQIGGKPFHREKSYLLAIPDFLATGGDKFDFLPNSKRIEKLNYSVRDMIITHIRALSEQSIPVESRLDGRVIELP